MKRRDRLALELLLCAVRDYRGESTAQLLIDIAYNDYEGGGVVFGDATLQRTLRRLCGPIVFDVVDERLVRARIALFLRAWLRSSKEPDEWGDLDLGPWRLHCKKCGWIEGNTTPAPACDIEFTGNEPKTRRIWPLWESAKPFDPAAPRQRNKSHPTSV